MAQESEGCCRGQEQYGHVGVGLPDNGGGSARPGEVAACIDDDNIGDVHAAQGLLRARGGAEVVIQQR